MCTVTYIPTGNKAFVTSNRDEHVSRKALLTPKKELLNGLKVVYPKDKTAGGTWFALNENGTVTVLLNGAVQNHERQPPYRKSRGLIVLDIVSKFEPVAYLKEIDLKGIEPFTLIVYKDSVLFEFRWDAVQKRLKQLDAALPYIWSSWTLYNQAAQLGRNGHFQDFVNGTIEFEKASILDFHRTNHGDAENGFVIDRSNGLKTLSISQAIIGTKEIRLNHHDLTSDEMASQALPINSPIRATS
ncbi:NRDE family protein [Muricauda sp. SCSIO 64092]|uniref:NRDE family protein n=1 Tax=Allomuricauda sp. SCSIO 64092 TaxID=2908842 RepID=UPI001FF6AA1D|nr:NRDE family protein [Muricauda sp. SCSIO 64092]UOY07556.1 NRDE family protein [Muricauda sp. SCSIO 64092]